MNHVWCRYFAINIIPAVHYVLSGAGWALATSTAQTDLVLKEPLLRVLRMIFPYIHRYIHPINIHRISHAENAKNMGTSSSKDYEVLLQHNTHRPWPVIRIPGTSKPKFCFLCCAEKLELLETPAETAAQEKLGMTAHCKFQPA